MSVQRIDSSTFLAIRDTLHQRTYRTTVVRGVTARTVRRAVLTCEQYVLDAALEAEGRPRVRLTAEEMTEAVLDARQAGTKGLRHILSVWAADLRRLNRMAYAVRYGKTYEDPGPLSVGEMPDRLSDLSLYKALRHVEHNTPEARQHDRYDAGRLPHARAILSALLSETARSLVEASEEYASAPWVHSRSDDETPVSA